MAELIYRVPGMSCGHCERAVKQEVGEVVGVATVEINLETKLVVVRGDDLSDEAVRAAIHDAGYEVEAA